LGFSSILLLAAALFFLRVLGGDLGGPIAIACTWFSVLLGALAAREGSKWWLVIPVPIVLFVILGFVLLFLGYYE
jgi:hypothetical protein